MCPKKTERAKGSRSLPVKRYPDEISDQPPSCAPGTTNIEIEHTLDSLFDHIDYKVVSGFMMALGVVAIVLAFSMLHAATFGTAGIVVGSLGLASMLSGIGFFTTGYTHESKILNPYPTQITHWLS